MAIYKKGTTQAQKTKSIIIIIVLVVLLSIPIYKIGKKLLSYTTNNKSSSTSKQQDIVLICRFDDGYPSWEITLWPDRKVFLGGAMGTWTTTGALIIANSKFDESTVNTISVEMIIDRYNGKMTRTFSSSQTGKSIESSGNCSNTAGTKKLF